MVTKREQVAEYLKKHPYAKVAEVCNACDCCEGTVKVTRRLLKTKGVPTEKPAFKAGPVQGVTQDEDVQPETLKPGERKLVRSVDKDSQVLNLRSCDITTLEAALEYAKTDLTVWRVKKHTIKFYEGTMRVGVKTTETVNRDDKGNRTGSETVEEHTPGTYTMCAIHIELVPIVPEETRDALDNIIESMKQHAPKYPIIIRAPLSKKERFLYEVAAVVDPHLARMSWGKETGVDWDMKLATAVLTNAVSDLLVRCKPYPVERILLPLGNDAFEINDTTNTTPRNHNSLYVDGRYINVFERGFECLRGIVDQCLSVAPVTILWIPGNHDPQTSYHVVRLIEMNYANCKDVTVDRSPPTRKAFVYGPTFLGFTHGCDLRQKDVAAIFMSEFRERVANCKHIEVHLGHTHTMKETRTLYGNTEIGGVRVRVLPSLSALSNWEYEMGFSSQQCAEAYLWSSERGYSGHMNTYARFPEQQEN